MTVGRGSSVTVNKFVYNSQQGVGEQSAKLTKGALRFVGGAVSHTEGAKIETPSGSMAVRGGMAYICLNCPQGAVFAALAGEVTLSKGGSTVTIPPGEMVTVLPDGTFSTPTPIPLDLLETLDSRFASGGGQDGGASNPPTENGAAQQLGDARMPDGTPWQGLGDIGAFWGGNAIVQSQAQSNNQASANGVHVLTTTHSNRPPCTNCRPTSTDGANIRLCPLSSVALRRGEKARRRRYRREPQEAQVKQRGERFPQLGAIPCRLPASSTV
jgi:hypothetical protein